MSREIYKTVCGMFLLHLRKKFKKETMVRAFCPLISMSAKCERCCYAEIYPV